MCKIEKQTSVSASQPLPGNAEDKVDNPDEKQIA